MSQINLETATIRLYEDTGLTDELADASAVVLLKWGAEQLKLLVEQSQEEESFEEKFKSLRKLTRLVNRLVGKHHEMDAIKQDKYLQKITEYAQVLGFEISPEIVQPAISKFDQLDEESKIHTLLVLLKTTDNIEQTDSIEQVSDIEQPNNIGHANDIGHANEDPNLRS
jgi:hypothetical protein